MPHEYETLPEWVKIAVEVMRSEQMMWLMAGSNYVESNLAALRPVFSAYAEAGGPTWGNDREMSRQRSEGDREHREGGA